MSQPKDYPSKLPGSLMRYRDAFQRRHPDMHIDDIRQIARIADEIRIAAILAQYPIDDGSKADMLAALKSARHWIGLRCSHLAVANHPAAWHAAGDAIAKAEAGDT